MALLGHAGEPFSNGAIIARRVRESLGGEGAAESSRGLAVMGIQLGQQCAVILRVHHHTDAVMVLGRGAKHRRAANIDVLDDGLEISTAREGFAEGIKIADQKVDGGDAMGEERRLVLRLSRAASRPPWTFG